MVPIAILVLAQSPSSSVPKRISNEFSKALRAKDYEWCERHLAPDFVYRGQKGDVHDRDWMLGRIRTWFHPLGYRVEASLALVSAKEVSGSLLLVSDLAVRSQLFGLRAMPVTTTTLRGESRWRPRGAEWVLDRIVERSSSKVVNGKPVSD